MTAWRTVGQLKPSEVHEIRIAVSKMRNRRLELAIETLDVPEVWRRLQEKNSAGLIRVVDDEVKVEGRHFDYQLHHYSRRGWQVYSLGKKGDPIGRVTYGGATSRSQPVRLNCSDKVCDKVCDEVLRKA